MQHLPKVAPRNSNQFNSTIQTDLRPEMGRRKICLGKLFSRVANIFLIDGFKFTKQWRQKLF
jgi:hypothetical protein